MWLRTPLDIETRNTATAAQAHSEGRREGWAATLCTRKHRPRGHTRRYGRLYPRTSSETVGFCLYCLYGCHRAALVRHCIPRGVDVETLHADVCTHLDLFRAERSATPGAECAAEAIQVPVYASLTDRQLRHVAPVVRSALLTQQMSARSDSGA